MSLDPIRPGMTVIALVLLVLAFPKGCKPQKSEVIMPDFDHQYNLDLEHRISSFWKVDFFITITDDLCL